MKLKNPGTELIDIVAKPKYNITEPKNMDLLLVEFVDQIKKAYGSQYYKKYKETILNCLIKNIKDENKEINNF